MEQIFSIRTFRNIWKTSLGCHFFSKFRKMLTSCATEDSQKNKFSQIFWIVIEKRRYQLYLLLLLPGVVVGVLGGAVDSAAVGGEVGSALHSSKSQQSTLQDARSPL